MNEEIKTEELKDGEQEASIGNPSMKRRFRTIVKAEMLAAIDRSNLWKNIEMAAVVCTIIALGFALLQTAQSANQLGLIKSLAQSTQQLEQLASTRHAGNFPENIPEITELVSSTKSRLTIVADVVGYGHYSHPVYFGKYRRELEKAVQERDVEIEIYVYNDRIIEESRTRQFMPEEKPFSEFQQTERYRRYFRQSGRPEQEMPTTWDEFFEMLQENNNRLVRLLRSSGIEVSATIDRRREVLVWISDDQKAIFTMAGQGAETSFMTRDPELIKILKSMTGRPA